MNKTLLLIICDFLLLNLLALTRWEKAEPPRSQATAVAAKPAAAPPQVNADMVELMRISLEDEKASREQLAQQLASTQGTLQQREQNLQQLQQQRTQLQGALASTQEQAKATEQKLQNASQQAALTREQLARIQRELEDRKAEAERQKEQLAALERQNTEARQRIENLNVAVRVAEQEKQLVTQNLAEAKQQIEVERQERAKVQEQTTQLAQGVGQLAERSGELTKEIRDNRPSNPNQIFTDFLANRVETSMTAERPGLFGTNTKDKAAQTVLVSDGQRTFALMHLTDTPLALSIEAAPEYERISGRIRRNSFSAEIREIDFLALDPRVIAIPVDANQAALMGAKVYRLAPDPFKFPEAVLVRAEDGRYGETPFRIDAQNPGYVKVDNRIVTRLFGEFSPRRGDLMFSKSGDLIGIMVNNDYCLVLGNFRPSQTLAVGTDVTLNDSKSVFTDLASRWSRLPLKLQ